MNKINKELLNKLNGYLEFKKSLQDGYGVQNSDECANVENNIRYIKNQIIREHAETIINLAYVSQDNVHNGVVYLNLISGELESYSLTSNTSINEQELFLLYRLESNWVSNNNWKYIDIVDEEEWKQLQKKFKDEADFLDHEQLESINILLDDRLMKYLEWEIVK